MDGIGPARNSSSCKFQSHPAVPAGRLIELAPSSVRPGRVQTLASIGVDNTNYSGISMRRGGISAGLAARVPEPILFLQSGHGFNCAARNYMVPRDPHVLYKTYLAFGLQL